MISRPSTTSRLRGGVGQGGEADGRAQLANTCMPARSFRRPFPRAGGAGRRPTWARPRRPSARRPRPLRFQGLVGQGRSERVQADAAEGRSSMTMSIGQPLGHAGTCAQTSGPIPSPGRRSSWTWGTSQSGRSRSDLVGEEPPVGNPKLGHAARQAAMCSRRSGRPGRPGRARPRTPAPAPAQRRPRRSCIRHSPPPPGRRRASRSYGGGCGQVLVRDPDRPGDDQGHACSSQAWRGPGAVRRCRWPHRLQGLADGVQPLSSFPCGRDRCRVGRRRRRGR